MVASAVGAGYGATASAQSASAIQPHWVGSWGASPAFPNGPEVVKQTIRQVVRLSLGGRAVRIRISNEMGTSPLVIGSAHIARPGQKPGSIDPATDHVLTFSGRPSITVPVGAPLLSDPVNLDAKALDSLSISLYVPRATGPTATHPEGAATAYISNGGDATSAATLPNPTTSTARFFISDVDVAADEPDAGTVVALGDSITDGGGSAVDANHRWPDVLAERLVAAHLSLGVVDAGISGNRILHDLPRAEYGPAALARFDRDVLSVPGVRMVILLESINDIGLSASAGLPEQAVTADDITAGMRQIVERAHAHGIRVLGATLTPFADTIYSGYYTKEGEQKRQAVNRWIREGGAFDSVIDFDAAMRDPVHPDHLAAQYDVGDHVHPNDAGYRRMGEAVDLAMLRKN
jgi:lysophospholipase L1-like esterase